MLAVEMITLALAPRGSTDPTASSPLTLISAPRTILARTRQPVLVTRPVTCAAVLTVSKEGTVNMLSTIVSPVHAKTTASASSSLTTISVSAKTDSLDGTARRTTTTARTHLVQTAEHVRMA